MEVLINELFLEIIKGTTLNKDGTEKTHSLRFSRFFGILIPYERPDGSLYLRNALNEEFYHIVDNKSNYVYVRYKDGSSFIPKSNNLRIKETPLRLVSVLGDCKNITLAAELLQYFIISVLGSHITDGLTVNINKQTGFLEETKTDVQRQKTETPIITIDFTLKSTVNNSCSLLDLGCSCGENITINLCSN